MAPRPRGLKLGRRGFLASAALSGFLLSCGADPQPESKAPAPDVGSPDPIPMGPDSTAGAQKIRYGNEHPDQFAVLRMPSEAPLATVVLLHGGYWRPEYGLDLMDPFAEKFVALGFATWNVEYRRTDAGGGVPTTLADAAAAVDRLGGAGLPPGLNRKVVVVGHSAGGHLAAWVASRTNATPGGPPAFPLRGAISLSGVLDLTRAASSPSSSVPVTAFVGGSPDEVPDDYAVADPSLLVPPACPVWAVQATEDEVVPADQSSSYAAAARAVGGAVRVIPVPGDHFTLIDPDASSFPRISKLVQASAI